MARNAVRKSVGALVASTVVLAGAVAAPAQAETPTRQGTHEQAQWDDDRAKDRGRGWDKGRDRDRDRGKGKHKNRQWSVDKFTHQVRTKKVLDHLEELQEIADEHGDRASGRPGYEASVRYVVKQLRKAGYRPEVQEFTFDYEEDLSEMERVSPDPRTYEAETDFARNLFDDPFVGEVTAPVVPVDVRLDAVELPANTSTSGCEAEDFAGFTAGSIALLQRGTCAFELKADNAEAAGAVGVIIMNEGQPGRDALMYMGGVDTGVPLVSTSYEVGAELAEQGDAVVRISVDFLSEERTSYNVIAETRKGDPANVVMAGAHLDSVQDGAGINDNASGSAALLEVAIQYGRKIKPENQVRFVWWGAEESGLLGAEHYVGELTEEERDDIALYLNFDMVASPNYMLGVYDGDNSSGTAPEGFIPEGSAEIEDVFESFYTSRGETAVDSEFSGRSDYGPFIEVGIPAGGLFTGAEGLKTEEEAELYGGIAGEAYDPCYHAACDNLRGEGQDEELYDRLDEEYRLRGNVNVEALDINTDAIAAAVLTFGYDTSTLP